MKQLLQEETERMERLRAKRSEVTTPSHLTSTTTLNSTTTLTSGGGGGHCEGSSGKRDLYKVALLLREANRINQSLNTNLVSLGILFFFLQIF